MNAEIINDYSTIGNNCIKLTPIDISTTTGTWIRFYHNFTKENVDLKLSADVKVVDVTSGMFIQANITGGTYESRAISLPSGTDDNKYVTIPSPSNVNSLQIQFNFTEDLTNNSVVYIDNICIEEV